MHRMKYLLFQLIGADADGRTERRGQTARQPGDSDLKVGHLLQPVECGRVNSLVQQFSIEWSDGAEWFAAPPCSEIEIFQLRIACADKRDAHVS